MGREDIYDKPLVLVQEGTPDVLLRSSGEALAWVADQQGHIARLEELLNQEKIFGPQFSLRPWARALSIVDSKINQAREETRPEVKAQHLYEARQALDTLSELRFATAESTSGRRLLALAQTNPAAAWVELLWLRRGNLNPQNSEEKKLGFNEISNAVAFLDAWVAMNEHRLDARQAVATLEGALGHLQTKWDHDLSDTNRRVEQSREDIIEKAQKFGRMAVRALKRHRVINQKHQQNMLDMERAFSTEMQLRAAEKFWSSKRRVNRNRSRGSFKALCWVGGLGGGLLTFIYWILLKIFDVGQSFSLVHGLVFLVPMLAYVWLLRIFATEYRSNKNLADDAEEREAMIMTFKALEYEKRVGNEERLVILNALFRSHGSSGEEQVPLPVWEAILARLGK